MGRIKQYLLRLAGLIGRGFQRITKGLPIRGFPQRRIQWIATWIAGGVAVTMLMLMLVVFPRGGAQGAHPRSVACENSADSFWISLFLAQEAMFTARNKMNSIFFAFFPDGPPPLLKDLSAADLATLQNMIDPALSSAKQLLDDAITTVNQAKPDCISANQEKQIRRPLAQARDIVIELIDSCKSTVNDQGSTQAMATIEHFLDLLERALDHKDDGAEATIPAGYHPLSVI